MSNAQDLRVAVFPSNGMALDLVRKPWTFDVLVMENMFGDVLSDLGAALVGGMGMAPCAEIGERHGLFQPAHGSAPDIAGTSRANPTAMLLSAALMLDWLGEQHAEPACTEAGLRLERAIDEGYRSGTLRPIEQGGGQTTARVARGHRGPVTHIARA